MSSYNDMDDDGNDYSYGLEESGDSSAERPTVILMGLKRFQLSKS